jgi:hypothetical protein
MTNENRNKGLAISLVVLVLTTMLTYFLLNAKRGAEVNATLFKVDDLKSIDHILLESKKGRIELSYNGSRWLVNNRHRADARMIELIFATLLQAEPKRPVALGLRDSIASALEHHGVKISLFSGAEIEKTFYAGGNANKTQSYFKDPVSGEVYLVTIPGYHVYVSGIFEMDESGFRDKYVFAFNWRNFKSLSAEFPAHPKENFKVSLQKNYVTVEGMAKVDTARLNTFLDEVSLLTVDQYVDSVAQDKNNPLMAITIEDIANKKYQLTLFSNPVAGKVKGMVNGEPVYFQSARIQPLLRPKSFFAKQ